MSSAKKRAREDGVVALHRSRMFDWKPSAVVAVSPCPGAPLFAVGYECGSLELWDMNQLVCTQTVVGPSLELTSLAWARDSVSAALPGSSSPTPWRTFAAFLDGSVAEVVWRSSSVAHSIDSYGGVVWALVASPLECVKPGFAHLLAAACDDGSVRLFGCESGEPGLVAERVLARLEGRLLCCAWQQGGGAVAVAGTAGSVHVLDAVTGREQLRVTVSPQVARPVTVWRLVWLPDGTLVSGDSDGATQMWDGRFGTQLGRFAQHKADVLALAATADGSTVFAAGVDSQVAMFSRVPGSSGRPDTWAYTHYKRPHTHDVRALGVLELGSGGVAGGAGGAGGEKRGGGSVLLSGGVDAQLIAYHVESFLQEHPIRLCKVPQRPQCQASAPSASASASAPRLLVAQHDTVDVWQVAEPSAPSTSYATHGSHAGGRQGGARGQQQKQGQGSAAGSPEGESLELVAGPRHLARIRVKGGRLVAAALSASGRYVAVTTPVGTRAYGLDTDAQAAAAAAAAGVGKSAHGALPVAVKRLRLEGPGEEPATAVAATDQQVVVAHSDGSLLCFALPGGEPVSRCPARASGPAAGPGAAHGDGAQAWRGFSSAVSQLVVPDDGRMVAAVGRAGISLHRLPGLQQHGRILRADAAFTAVGFSRDGKLLAATTSSCQLLVWDTADCKQLQWSLDNAEAASTAIGRLPGTPTCISFCPAPPGPSDDASTPATPAHRLVVSSPGGLVHFDLGKQVDDEYIKGLTAKRQRGRLRPDQSAAPEDRPEGRGANGRIIRTLHPCVWLGHVRPGEMLLLEKPWEEVLAALPPPLLTHRYGS